MIPHVLHIEFTVTHAVNISILWGIHAPILHQTFIGKTKADRPHRSPEQSSLPKQEQTDQIAFLSNRPYQNKSKQTTSLFWAIVPTKTRAERPHRSPEQSSLPKQKQTDYIAFLSNRPYHNKSRQNTSLTWAIVPTKTRAHRQNRSPELSFLKNKSTQTTSLTWTVDPTKQE